MGEIEYLRLSLLIGFPVMGILGWFAGQRNMPKVNSSRSNKIRTKIRK